MSAIYGEERESDYFVQVSAEKVAFPGAEELTRVSQSLSTRSGPWTFLVSGDSKRRVLRAVSSEVSISQSITPNAVFKRFVFDLKKQRFEPMRQEIRIEYIAESELHEIEGLPGVTAVKRYKNLGFAIVKVEAEINPVQVLGTLKSDFSDVNAQVLTGFFEYEPM